MYGAEGKSGWEREVREEDEVRVLAEAIMASPNFGKLKSRYFFSLHFFFF
jgi:hypothetical protein